MRVIKSVFFLVPLLLCTWLTVLWQMNRMKNHPIKPNVIVFTPVCNITVVTSYFQMQSKFNHDTYVPWIKRFLSLRICMVIFSDRIEELRPWNNNVSHHLFLESDMNQDIIDAFPYLSQNDWQRQLDIDPEKDIHRSYQLFWVWLLKPTYVQKAIDIHPFGSQYYFWVDIGIIRQQPIDLERWYYQNDLPMALQTPHLFIQGMFDFDGTETHKSTKRTSAGVFGGEIPMCLWYHQAFNETLFLLNEKTWFFGDDQIVQTYLVSTQPHHFMFVKVTPKGEQAGFDVWLSLLYALLGDTEHYRVYNKT